MTHHTLGTLSTSIIFLLFLVPLPFSSIIMRWKWFADPHYRWVSVYPISNCLDRFPLSATKTAWCFRGAQCTRSEQWVQSRKWIWVTITSARSKTLVLSKKRYFLVNCHQPLL
jgi:hypothetical protein